MINIIILIFIIIIIIFLLFRYKNNKPKIISEDNNTENNYTKKKHKTKKEYFDNGCINDPKDGYDMDELIKYSEKDIQNRTNENFIQIQYHTDYRDTMAAFNNVAPSQKQIFNLANVPVKKSNPDYNEVKDMIIDFIEEVNKNIKMIADYRNSNTGWDEPIPDKRIRFGWEKQMQAIGVPPNLYPDPASKCDIKLIAIDHVEKEETDDEIKYTCYLIIQKKNVSDQLIVRVSFVLSKSHMIPKKKLFVEVANKYDSKTTSVVIEEIFIVGYLTKQGITKTDVISDNFYNFDGLEKQEIVDQALVMRELNKKLRDRNANLNTFNDNLDEEGRNFHRDLPHLRNYDAYQVTETIYDDFTKERIWQ